MTIKKPIGERMFDLVNMLLLLGLVVITLYPLLYVLFASISQPNELVKYRGLLLAPLGFSSAAYKAVFMNPNIITGYRNTLFYVVAGTTLNLALTCLGAYALSRKNVMLKVPITVFFIFTLFFSGGLIPTYLLVARTLNWIDTPWAIIVPTAVSTFNLLILRTAFEQVPPALEEAARIDGANDFTILWRVIIPLSLPSIAVVLLFYAVGHWNAYFNALIYLRNRELYPLQLVLREILIANQTGDMTTGTLGGDVEPIAETIKYATIVVATAPILLLYPFLQRYFVKGVMIGGVKE
ncbi:MAG: carbohydrate ABC transporter permease [Caldilineaceae bacterium]